jgi:hypothetical protein
MLRGCLEAGVAEATLAKASVGAAALAEAAEAEAAVAEATVTEATLAEATVGAAALVGSGLGWQRPWWPITPSSAGEANWVVRTVRTWRGNRDDPRNQPLD